MKKYDMPYRSLGRSGTQVSQLGLGGWTTFGESVTEDHTIRDILQEAFSAGINFFDIADVYGRGEAECAMGKVLRDFPRTDLVISSKVFFPMSDHVNDQGLSRKHIMESVHQSLKRIGIDYLDIYFCHRFDEKTPMDETARAMDDLVHQGKILYWGTSEWSGAQLQALHQLCDQRDLYPPQVEQPRYNLLARERLEKDVRPVALEHGMGLVTFSPLAFGVLSGKYDQGMVEGTRIARYEWMRGRYFAEEVQNRIRKMKEPADRLGCTRAQLALAWITAQKGISSVITGATRVQQLQENLGSLSVTITKEVDQSLRALFPVGISE